MYLLDSRLRLQECEKCKESLSVLAKSLFSFCCNSTDFIKHENYTMVTWLLQKHFYRILVKKASEARLADLA